MNDKKHEVTCDNSAGSVQSGVEYDSTHLLLVWVKTTCTQFFFLYLGGGNPYSRDRHFTLPHDPDPASVFITTR